MNPKRSKVTPIRNPTLLEMEKLEEAEKPASGPAVERPYSLPGTFGGTEVIEEECRVIRSRLKLITLLRGGLLNKSGKILREWSARLAWVALRALLHLAAS